MVQSVRTIESVTLNHIPYDELFDGNEPVVMKGLVSQWPLVQAATQSPHAVKEILIEAYNGDPIITYSGAPEMQGRFAYNETITGFNYQAERRDLTDTLNTIFDNFGEYSHPYYYMNSIVLDETFPTLSARNSLNFNHPVFERSPRVAKIWIGTQSRASAHYDIPRNIACCVLGRRRFTLFSPDQVANLYPGPLGLTPGGQIVTMADLQNPDFERFPRLRQALDQAVIADLEPGDALYYPSMWWHEVDAIDAFNVMINYWWVDAPAYMGNPMDILMHAMLGLRDLPPAEKAAWREMFDYYIFGDPDIPRAHLPQHTHGALANMDETTARKLRGAVHRSLNR